MRLARADGLMFLFPDLQMTLHTMLEAFITSHAQTQGQFGEKRTVVLTQGWVQSQNRLFQKNLVQTKALSRAAEAQGGVWSLKALLPLQGGMTSSTSR